MQRPSEVVRREWGWCVVEVLALPCKTIRWHWGFKTKQEAEGAAFELSLEHGSITTTQWAERVWTKVHVPVDTPRPYAASTPEQRLLGGKKAKGLGGKAKRTWKEKAARAIHEAILDPAAWLERL